ncbi:MAG: diphosphomevalonate decarboxylase [Pontiellaceae bacterium]|nr:diphosphomevalonate decarboxylase [Pontiellaceae bacterium]MBN2784974.1 diphosphomevalonate decarboxylase [Pontiellaceae bacterium]
MDDIQSQFVEKILANTSAALKTTGEAFAPSNIALCKYWGKRDASLNLPINSSLSISLGKLGTRTSIRVSDVDRVVLNGAELDAESSFALRVQGFLNLFRPALGDPCFEVITENNIPTAAGLASSASGFAALVLALDQLAGWNLGRRELSMLARMGSGSASRSVFEGFVLWHAGCLTDGTDSYAHRLDYEWPEFRIGVLELTASAKPVGSRDGMNRTVETSALYESWPAQAGADLVAIRDSIASRDFRLLGKTAERNALSMHATMLSAWPPLLYLMPESIEQIHKVQRVRSNGLEIYLTIDAGPNIKLLFLADNEQDVCAAFPNLQVIRPFD